jgi:hypothetical protein
MILAPLLILGLLEAILRMAGYGYSTALFKPMEIGGVHYLLENEKFSYRFFPPELTRTPGPIKMLAEKPSGSYRIFILGESAAMGDPEPGYGASRYLEALLRERYPEAKFEIINVAFTAINSHVILPIAQDCAKQQSDLWLIYMGNNEMVGPFGAATVFGPKTPPLFLIRLNLALQTTRLGQLAADLRHHLKRKGSGPASWGGMQMFLGNQVPPDSSRRASVYHNFQSNLRGILEAGRKSGAHLLVNTVAVNLKDCPPFASYSATNLSLETAAKFEPAMTKAEALEKDGAFQLASAAYEKVLKLHPLSAEAPCVSCS